jgi:hypothetical protein
VDALNATNEAGEKLGPTLVDASGKIDTTSAAGSRLFDSITGLNDEMLLAIQRADEQAKAQGRSGISMEEAAAAAQPYIDKLWEAGNQAGLSAPQIQGLVDTMLATPSVVAFALTDNGTVDAEKLRLIDLASQIIATPDKTFEVSSDDFPGLAAALAALGIDITSLPAGQVKVIKDDGSFYAAEVALENLARQREVRLVVNEVSSSGNPIYQQGNRRLEQFGDFLSHGIPQTFGLGGFPSGIYKGRPGGIVKFAEPWLPWEAYISPDSGARDKNIGIAHEALKRMGAPAVPAPQVGYATGAFLEGATIATPRILDQQAYAALLGETPTRPPVQVSFINPVVRDLDREAWEAAQIIGGFGDDV